MGRAWGKSVDWKTLIKAAALFIAGGMLMGLLRGSIQSGALAGACLFGILVALGLSVVAFDHFGQRWHRRRPPGSPLATEE
jgi:uncharacterized membrane protein YfcA